jgi:zinc transporter 1/2/3
VAVILQGLAAGTLLYVVFFEVLARHKQSGFLHLLSIMLGFCSLLILQTMSEYLCS